MPSKKDVLDMMTEDYASVPVEISTAGAVQPYRCATRFCTKFITEGGFCSELHRVYGHQTRAELINEITKAKRVIGTSEPELMELDIAITKEQS